MRNCGDTPPPAMGCRPCSRVARVVLLPPSPLRTVHDTLASYRSSLSNAPGRDAVLPLSTPGNEPYYGSFTLVFRHSFDVDLPPNEWVSSRCKAFTLPFLPSCSAFTIRAWSRLTFLWTLDQFMVCQSTPSWEAAPTVLLSSVVICFASFVWLVRLSRNERPNGSLPAFAWDNVALRLDPYPLHYKAAFAYSILLCPQSIGFLLRFTYPLRGELRVYHVSFIYR